MVTDNPVIAMHRSMARQKSNTTWKFSKVVGACGILTKSLWAGTSAGGIGSPKRCKIFLISVGETPTLCPIRGTIAMLWLWKESEKSSRCSSLEERLETAGDRWDIFRLEFSLRNLAQALRVALALLLILPFSRCRILVSKSTTSQTPKGFSGSAMRNSPRQIF